MKKKSKAKFLTNNNLNLLEGIGEDNNNSGNE